MKNSLQKGPSLAWLRTLSTLVVLGSGYLSLFGCNGIKFMGPQERKDLVASPTSPTQSSDSKATQQGVSTQNVFGQAGGAINGVNTGTLFNGAQGGFINIPYNSNSGGAPGSNVPGLVNTPCVSKDGCGATTTPVIHPPCTGKDGCGSTPTVVVIKSSVNPPCTGKDGCGGSITPGANPPIKGLPPPFAGRGGDCAGPCPPWGYHGNGGSDTPLVLDLKGDGMISTAMALSGHPVAFDIDGDSREEKIAWVGPDVGILVVDRNHDGKISSGRQLFGNGMLDKSGKPFKDGFAALGRFDESHLGVIDSRNTHFNELMIWRDVNGNGVADAGELKSLSDYGITALYLDSKSLVDDKAIRQGEGAQIKLVASYTRRGSAKRYLLADIFFDRLVENK